AAAAYKPVGDLMHAKDHCLLNATYMAPEQELELRTPRAQFLGREYTVRDIQLILMCLFTAIFAVLFISQGKFWILASGVGGGGLIYPFWLVWRKYRNRDLRVLVFPGGVTRMEPRRAQRFLWKEVAAMWHEHRSRISFLPAIIQMIRGNYYR